MPKDIIQFKEDLFVDLFIGEKDSFSFSYDKPHKTFIVIHAEPPKGPGQRATAICTASLEWKASDRVRLDFETLANGALPEGSKLPKSHAYIIDSEGRIKEHHTVPPSALPEWMRSAINQASAELYDHTAKTIKTLRWRTNHPAEHNPILGTRGFYFSTDGAEWKSLMELSIEMEVLGSLDLAEEIRNEIETMIVAGTDEPLGHELYREALAHRHQNPRSSLIIAIAAAEVGFKECVGDLIPGARWLVDHVPSPPLVQMVFPPLVSHL
jgi:hypothetical protein